jgi:superoxide dismutase, Cu-Zn family
MRSPRITMAGLVGMLALAGCQADTAVIPSPPPPPPPVHNAEVSATFEPAPGTAITYDDALVKAGSRVAVEARPDGGSTRVKLAVRGLEPDRRYGAHVHTNSCGAAPADAGPHFQHEADPVQPSVDPRYANPQNEIWLDLTTDGTGAGTAETTVAWVVPEDRRPGSVVIHAMPTATGPGVAGTAGARAACVSVDF